jgi:Raf kinase inhibitor-like YbhB/YbcL family protein
VRSSSSRTLSSFWISFSSRFWRSILVLTATPDGAFLATILQLFTEHIMLEKLPPALGHLLEGQRAGLEKVVVNAVDLREGTGRIKLTSPAFADHAPMPSRFTADGEGISPPLDWRDIPTAATSLALIVEDADSPTPAPLVHAIAVDIDRRRKQLLEGELQATEHGRNTALALGRNSYLTQAWLPPDPPPGHGPHRYVFQLFALVDEGGTEDEPPRAFSSAPGRNELVEVLRERAVASGWLIGVYSRDNTAAIKKDEAVDTAGVTDAAAPVTVQPA